MNLKNQIFSILLYKNSGFEVKNIKGARRGLHNDNVKSFIEALGTKVDRSDDMEIYGTWSERGQNFCRISSFTS